MSCSINESYANMLKNMSDTDLLVYAREHVSLDSVELIHELCDRILELKNKPVRSKTIKTD